MSITLGIYDVFAYTIPGFLYLYLGYVVLLRFGLPSISLSSFPKEYSALVTIIVVTAAYLLGHLLDIFADWFVFKLFKRQKFSEKVLDYMKRRYTGVQIEFQPGQTGLLLSMLKNRNLARSTHIDTFQASSIMLRNISFGLLLLALLNIYELVDKYSHLALIIAVGSLIFSLVARNRSRMFHAWFVTDIYEASLDYGKNVSEVVLYDERMAEAKQGTSPKAKSKTSRPGVSEKA